MSATKPLAYPENDPRSAPGNFTFQRWIIDPVTGLMAPESATALDDSGRVRNAADIDAPDRDDAERAHGAIRGEDEPMEP